MKSKFNPSYVGLRRDIVALVKGENLNILDVGCSTGINGKYLLDKGIAGRVIGMELDDEMASHARQTYEKVIVGDLNQSKTLEELAGESFDYIIFGDVLEHLVNPDKVLQDIRQHLAIDGSVIISVPNIQHLDVFIHIFLKGTWPRNERGIFDKTHLRNFTLKDLKTMINDADLKLVDLVRHYRARDKPKTKFHPFYYAFRYIFKRFYTFQMVAVCKAKHSNA